MQCDARKTVRHALANDATTYNPLGTTSLETCMKKTTASTAPRRRFLKGAAAGTAGAALAAPMIAVAQSPVSFRFQSTWPAKDIFHEYALDFAKKVNDMAGGRVKIE